VVDRLFNHSRRMWNRVDAWIELKASGRCHGVFENFNAFL
jgi:hypothetical protein